MKASLLGLLLLVSCKDGTPVQVTNAIDEYHVEKLFTIDGCTVYRFEDNYSRYFTSCQGGVSLQRHVGKTSRPEDIQTERKE